MESPRKALLREFLDIVWSRGDAEAVEKFLAERYTIHNDPGDPWDGQTLSRDGFRDRLAKSRAVAPDQTFTAIHMVEESDRIAVAWDWTGTHLGDLPGIPATGKPLRMTGLTIYFLDANDRLTGHWQIADRLGIFRQISGA